MKTIKSLSELKNIISNEKKQGNIVGFVPTMGFLHKGHAALMKKARENCDFVVVSIFVNPAQFGEGEDFNSYPKDEKRDLEVCRSQQVDLIFIPEASDVYPNGYQAEVKVEELSNYLCGQYRKGHFDGVTTVVTKLFNMVLPDKAYFGLKDYQQFKIIKRLVLDLNFDIEIIGVPTIRDDDGIATSSRNYYLKEDERDEARYIIKALCKAEKMLKDGVKNTEEIKNTMRKLLSNKNLIKIQYLEIVDPQTFLSINQIEGQALVAIAVLIGKARLIDNLLISEMGESQCSAQC